MEIGAEKLHGNQQVDIDPMFGLSFLGWLLWYNVLECVVLGYEYETSWSFAKVQLAYKVLGPMLQSSWRCGRSEPERHRGQVFVSFFG